jgi:prepilin-type N-terminal cleavage/methylation domain-containing protein
VKTKNFAEHSEAWLQSGFSTIELLVVIAIIATLTAIATPRFQEIRQNAAYKSSARDIASMMRDARNRAITRQLQHAVQYDTLNRQYGLRVGNRAFNTDWTDTVNNPLPSNWKQLTTNVTMSNPVTLISFNPNGTSNTAGTVFVQDIAGNTIFRVDVVTSGKIRITP